MDVILIAADKAEHGYCYKGGEVAIVDAGCGGEGKKEQAVGDAVRDEENEELLPRDGSRRGSWLRGLGVAEERGEHAEEAAEGDDRHQRADAGGEEVGWIALGDGFVEAFDADPVSESGLEEEAVANMAGVEGEKKIGRESCTDDCDNAWAAAADFGQKHGG